jgi:Xaa-Pro dipeptidase
LAELVISQEEHKQRISKIRQQISHRRLKALYLVNPTRILYATGFSYLPTERPLAVVIPGDGPIFLMGPALEHEHVRQDARLIEEIFAYPDYPGKVHPIRYFARILTAKGLGTGRIATDSFEGAAGGYGYRGPSLTDVIRSARFLDGRDIIDKMRLVKSNSELRLLRESAKWSSIAHDILLENTKAGSWDVVVGVRSSLEALDKMLKRLNGSYRQLKWALSPLVVGYRGQIGPESAIPHTVFTKRKIRRGDVLVSEAGVEVGGYTSELERTIVVGNPSGKARKYFAAMLEAQTSALKAFSPGVRCRAVDQATRLTAEKLGLEKQLLHHTGHGIGLEGHEPPWLDPGDDTIMKPGMVFSCEPGFYFPGYAGFRHSDTVAITKAGMSFITEYPRNLDELTIQT